MTTKATHWKGPCVALQAPPTAVEAHASWDLDIGDGVSWQRAVQKCHDCPFRALCVQERNEFFPSSNPSGVIWAGVAYSETGKVLDTAGLRRLATTRRLRYRRGRPSRTAAIAVAS